MNLNVIKNQQIDENEIRKEKSDQLTIIER